MDNHEQAQKFGERLNQALAEKRITARQLATLSEISEVNISRYRKGIAMPARGKIIALANVLGVSPMWLLGYSDNKAYDLSPEEKLRNKIDGYMETMSKEQLEDAEDLIKRFILRR